MKILIIAGHGDGDPGACACGYQEATLAREYAPLLKAALAQYADVTLFDMNKNMYKQLKAGNSFNFKSYDYVVELHFNAGVDNQQGNGATTGTEILVHPSESGTSVEQAILNNICALGFKNRGVKTRTNLLNMNTCKGKQKVSYSLIETCFIDDLDDIKLYQSKKTEVVNAIAKGIISGFELSATSSTESEELDMMTATELEKRISKLEATVSEKTGYFNYIDKNMNDSYKPTIQKLVDSGKLKGNENGELMLTNDMMRILTILDRCGIFD